MEQDQSDTNVECSVCGMVGYPPPGCGICNGNARPQSRAFTRTEENQGKGGDNSRYGRTGNVSPKIVDLPGSMPSREG